MRSSKDAARFLKAMRATAPVTLNMKPRTLGVAWAPAVVPDAQLKVTVKSDAPGRVFLWAVDAFCRSRAMDAVSRSCASRRPRTSGRHAPDARRPDARGMASGRRPSAAASARESADAIANPFRRTMDRAAVWWREAGDG
ncbi:MAG: hypothetical protein ACLUHG_00105 [Sutterella wadsworthensis]